jgi:hypothetical protein
MLDATPKPAMAYTTSTLAAVTTNVATPSSAPNPLSLELRDSGVWVQGSTVQGLGFRVQGYGAKGLGLELSSLKFRV